MLFRVQIPECANAPPSIWMLFDLYWGEHRAKVIPMEQWESSSISVPLRNPPFYCSGV